MNNREKLLLADELGLERLVVTRLTGEELKTAPDLSQFSAYAQYQCIKHPELLSVSQNYVNTLASILEFRDVDVPEGFEWMCRPEVAAISLLLGVEYLENINDLPATVLDYEFLRDNPWCYQTRELCNRVGIMSRDAVLHRSFQDNTGCLTERAYKVLKNEAPKLLEEALSRTFGQNALINNPHFYLNCDFSSFESLPDEVFKYHYFPAMLKSDANSLGELLSLSEDERIALAIAGDASISMKAESLSLYTFRLLQHPMEWWEKYLADSSINIPELLGYSYHWDAESLKHAKLIIEYGLKKPLKDSVEDILKHHWVLWDDASKVRSSVLPKVIELAESGKLADICDALTHCSCWHREKIIQRMVSWLHDEVYRCPIEYLVRNPSVASEFRDITFEDSCTLAKILKENTDWDLGLIWLNLLDGNRFWEDGELVTVIDTKDLETVVVRGNFSSEDYLFGISGAPTQLIPFEDGMREIDMFN